MATTQEHVPIQAIHDDTVLLKNGDASIVLQTSAVNFDLLSEMEQIAIIDAFAAFLNSLSFPIQLVIRSKRLDISSYLESLQLAENKQVNPLLRAMVISYRNFIETITRENEVLDKQFYIVITVSHLELGIISNLEKNFQRALTTLLPRKDHVIKQLNRIGLKADQLNSASLLKLFYDMYNEAPVTQLEEVGVQVPVLLAQQPQPIQPKAPASPSPTLQPPPQPPSLVSQPRRITHTPFVVEELPDDYASN